MRAEKLLVICARDEHYDDFVQIGKRVNRLDGSIIVSVYNGLFHPSTLPLELRHLRLLTLYLVNPPATLPARGHTLCVKDLGKLEEYKNFVAAGIPIPRAIPYLIGDTVDADEWGEYVILKPTNESLGRGVLLIPTTELRKIKAHLIPADHLLLKSNYMLQQFIDTGPLIPGYRVMGFMGQSLLSYKWENITPGNFPKTLEDAFSKSLFGAGENERVRELVIKDDILDFAQKAFQAHPDYPLQGLDIIRDVHTKELFILENNSGGNVWSFSMQQSNPFRAFGRKAMLMQFMAWDVAAEILVKKTNELAV